MSKTHEPPAIRVMNVWKAFDSGSIPVLKGASFIVKAGEMLALWGRSGSGKSTLLHLMGGLEQPDDGCLDILGCIPAKEEDRLKIRRDIVGFVFQLHNLIPNLTLEENCLLPTVATGRNCKEAVECFEELAEKTGILHRRSQFIQKLSGGERQRAALCRALINHPKVLLADEPTGALDEHTGDQIFELMQALCRSHGVTIVMATHERRFAERCDRILLVREGVIQAP